LPPPSPSLSMRLDSFLFFYLSADLSVLHSFPTRRSSDLDEADSKLICETVIPFEQTRKELWLQYPDKAAYLAGEQELFAMLADTEGDDEVIIYCRKEKAVKKLPPGRNVKADKVLLSRLTNYLGEACVK